MQKNETIADAFLCFFNEWRSQNKNKNKQNKNMINTWKCCYNTYFYNISLNVRRSTFLNTYNLPFSRSTNIGKIMVNVIKKWQSILPTLRASARTELQFSIIYFQSYVAKPRTSKTVPAIFLFSNIFWIIYFKMLTCKIHFQNSSSYCNKNLKDS